MHKHHTIITIALFGSLWGLIEATLGGILHLAHIPYTGTIMASFGFAIIFAALKSGLKPASLIAVGLFAASFKFLDPFIFNIAFFDRTAVNPAVAIATQGLAFTLVFRRCTSTDRIVSLAPRFLIAAAISMLAFNATSLGAFGWPTNHTEHPLNAAFVQLPLMAAGATILSKTAALIFERRPLTMSLQWQVAAAAACAALVVAARLMGGEY